MQIFSNFKNYFTAGLLLLLVACNSDASKDKAARNNKETTDTSVAPPPIPKTEPPGVEMIPAEKKCYANDGLNYKIVVTLFFGNNEIAGNVTSEELESGKKEISKFGGTMNGNVLTIKFEGTPPVIGAASEWTDKPWNLKKDGGKEKLHIVFSAKNYDTNKWEDTDYQFVLVDCK